MLSTEQYIEQSQKLCDIYEYFCNYCKNLSSYRANNLISNLNDVLRFEITYQIMHDITKLLYVYLNSTSPSFRIEDVFGNRLVIMQNLSRAERAIFGSLRGLEDLENNLEFLRQIQNKFWSNDVYILIPLSLSDKRDTTRKTESTLI